MHRSLYRVIKEHKASFPEAMIAEKGDRVKVGKEDPEMPGWYWYKARARRLGYLRLILIWRMEKLSSTSHITA